MIEIKGNVAFLSIECDNNTIMFYRNLGYEVVFYV